jgi:hypothetical protein
MMYSIITDKKTYTFKTIEERNRFIKDIAEKKKRV